MNLSNGIILTDRSRTTEDWKCKRKRWWAYEFAGIGLTSEVLKLELFLGTILHDGLAAIAVQHPDVDINKIAELAHDTVFQTLAEDGDEESAHEQACLVEGLLRGFYKHAWPRLMAQFPRIVAVEQEMVYDVDERLRFMSRPDLLLEDAEGQLWYIEYKSTSSKKDQWINSWSYAIQVHSSVKAIEQTLGRPVAGVIVQGLYKGYESYGKLSSPFCYAYKRNGNPPFTKDAIAFEYTKGMFRTPIWELAGGVGQAIEAMPEHILSEQFPCSPPIFVKDEMVETFFRQLALREAEIELAKNFMASTEEGLGALDVTFPQNFEACNPGWGKPCEFLALCHSGKGDPFTRGYQERVPHHQEEVERYAQHKL